MNQRKAYFFFGLQVLLWSIFWHGAIRIISVRRAAQKGDSPAASGLLVVA